MKDNIINVANKPKKDKKPIVGSNIDKKKDKKEKEPVGSKELAREIIKPNRPYHVKKTRF